ncbi:MAG: NmrA family NAD(P)-binding protein [Actinomycetota bacterium]|nr:NmrA family NAD(P)-binding protein [Actinomycetota bacterium]
MMLLVGASGQVGSRVARMLAGRDEVRALAHSDRSAVFLIELGFEVVSGDLGDRSTLNEASKGVDSLFLVTPFTPSQLEHEANALDAGRELRRVVKISALNRGVSFSRPHEEIERRLQASELEVSVLRPDFIVSGLMAQRELIRQGQIVFPADGARRAFIDPNDIAEVAVHEVTAINPVGGHLLLTGPESLSFAELAGRLSARLGRRVDFVDVPAHAWREGLVDSGVPDFYADALVELFERDIKPSSISVSEDVERVLGRSPRRIDHFIEHEISPAIA